MCYPICGIVHIKEPLLLIVRPVAHVVAAAGFLTHCGPLPCRTPNKCKYNVLAGSLNKIFLSFLPFKIICFGF